MIKLGDKVKIKAKESELYGFIGIVKFEQKALLGNISYFLIETAEGQEWVKSIDLEKL